MSGKLTARLVTLGCARNDVDSEELAGRLAREGWRLLDSEETTDPDSPKADVVLVNTCGFIESAKAESVNTILAAADSDVPVVAVGCMAERYGEELADAMPEAAAVVGFDGYQDISENLRRVVAGERLPSHEPRDRRELLPISPVLRRGVTEPPGHGSGESPPTGHPTHKESDADNSDAGQLEDDQPGASRLPEAASSVLRRRLGGGPVAPLKIASGCDRRCAFCAIPRFRGAFVSRTAGEILAEAEWLADHGVVEAVLVSENSTSYGKDLGDPRALERLLPRLATILPRIRVSYLQPAETRPGLIQVIARTENVASYYDMSFQHASGQLLRSMRRFGDAESFLAMVEQIRGLAPAAGVRSNVIVGFPGETEADVATLIDFLSTARMDAVGVFGYSDEEDTEGRSMAGKLDEDEIAARVAEVNIVVEHSTAERALERVGDRVDVLVESVEDGVVRGRAEHQGPEDSDTAWTPRPGEPMPTVGEIVTVEVIGADGVDLLAETPSGASPRRQRVAGDTNP